VKRFYNTGTVRLVLEFGGANVDEFRDKEFITQCLVFAVLYICCSFNPDLACGAESFELTYSLSSIER
jgi:hypothetical protein